ncbi:MAG: gamma-glutamyl-gamma-aminobutyrate hydrolase family protein, partial [Nitrospirota bacterium]
MTKEMFLVLQHVKSEGIGVFEDVLKKKDIGHKTVRLWEGDRVPDNLDGYRGLVVMGGPMGVYEENRYPFLRDEIRLIKKAIAEDFPAIGICLGSQLIAEASGARVYPGDVKEIGWYEINVTEDGMKD